MKQVVPYPNLAGRSCEVMEKQISKAELKRQQGSTSVVGETTGRL